MNMDGIETHDETKEEGQKGLHYTKDSFEKMIRRNAYHGSLNLVIVCSLAIIFLDFMRGFMKGLELNQLWAVPIAILFFVAASKFMQDA